jgi:hypothetical protein
MQGKNNPIRFMSNSEIINSGSDVRKDGLSRFLFPLIVLLTLFSPKASAQQYATLFWMQGIPQSNYANPALIPQPGYFFGMPALSSIYLNASNRGFAIDDFVRRNEFDETYWDNEGLFESLVKKNLFHAEASMEWFSFGLRRRANFLSFGLADKISLIMAYPGDLARLVLNGSKEFMPAQGAGDFAGFSMNHLHYREFSMSFAREFSSVFAIGLRGRVLFGLRNQWVKNARFELYPDPSGDGLLLHPEVMLNHSSSKSLGLLDAGPFRFPASYGVNDFRASLDNAGAAVDLGMVIRPATNFSLAFSVLDLGFLGWKEGVENYLIRGSSEYDGIDAEDFFSSRFIGNMESFIDGVPDYFQVAMTKKGYRTLLAPKFLTSAGLELSDRHQLALLSQGMLYEGRMYPSFTLSYNVRPSRATGLSLAWSAANRNYYNIGLGMHANLGPFQIYAVGDNLLGFIVPNHVQWNSVHVGFNWVFDYRPQTEDPIYSW